jgi:hypothetical protein
MKERTGLKIFVGIVIAVVSAAIVGGLFLSGTPEQMRLLRFDKLRTSDLRQISNEVEEYWQRRGKLPDNLQVLTRDPGRRIRSLRDPKSKELYEYSITGDTTFQLCATFETDTTASERAGMRKPASEEFWAHGIGRTCFDFEALPDSK